MKFSASEIECKITLPATELKNDRTVGRYSIDEMTVLFPETNLLENLIVPNLRILGVGFNIAPMLSLLLQ